MYCLKYNVNDFMEDGCFCGLGLGHVYTGITESDEISGCSHRFSWDKTPIHNTEKGTERLEIVDIGQDLDLKLYTPLSFFKYGVQKLWDVHGTHLPGQLHSSTCIKYCSGQSTWLVGHSKGILNICFKAGSYSQYQKGNDLSDVCTAVHNTNTVLRDVTNAHGIQCMFTCTQDMGQYTHALATVFSGAWLCCWLFGCPGPPSQGRSFKRSSSHVALMCVSGLLGWYS